MENEILNQISSKPKLAQKNNIPLIEKKFHMMSFMER